MKWIKGEWPKPYMPIKSENGQLMPKLILLPQYQLPESMFDKRNKVRKQHKHRYRLINNTNDGCVEIRVKNSDLDADRIVNVKSAELRFEGD